MMKHIFNLLSAFAMAGTMACHSADLKKQIGRQWSIRLPVDASSGKASTLLYLPDDYDSRPDKRYPLLIFLHAAGEGLSDSVEELLHTGLPELIAKGLQPFGIDSSTGDTVKYIIVSPHAARSGWSYQYDHVKWMLPYLEDNYRVDTNRVFISGISAGGFGAWTCLTADSIFLKSKITGIIPVSPVELKKENEKDVPNAAKYSIAVWVACGTKDAHFSGAVRYDTIIRNAHPVISNHLIAIKDGEHDSSTWNPVYTMAYKGFGGKNLWTRLLDYDKQPVATITWNKPLCKGVRRYIPLTGKGAYLNGSNFFCQPGDTLVLTAKQNPWSYFALEGIHGTAECPIVVINEGGQVKVEAIGASNCTYIKFTGSGSDDKYGFYLSTATGQGTAYDINGRSAFIEVERSDIYHKTYGAWIKQEAACADSLQYPNWHIHNISFHDNRMFNIGQDCIYAGSTSPNGMRTINCNGVSIHPVPLRLANIKIYNNIIDSVCRTGIQLSGADSGLNEIYHNKITRCGFELNAYQGTGISLGGYTHAYVHDNYIRQTFLNGIFSLGAGLVRIENNNIDSSGYLGKIVNPGASSIMVDTRKTSPVISTRFMISNNVTGLNTDAHIRVYKSVATYAGGNIICNNSGHNIKVESGIDWRDKCK